MPVPLHNQIRPGTLVSIVLKADQRSGRQVQGVVSDVLTRGNHPHGIKVRLNDGRIGRVQQLANQSTASPPRAPLSNQNSIPNRSVKMSNNPWATETSQGNPFQSEEEQRAEQQRQQQQPQQQDHQQQYQPPQYAPPQQQYSQQQYPQSQEPQQQQQYSDHSSNPPLPARNLQRSDTDRLLQSEPDRGEQFEHMQAYEASARQTEDDVNQAQLQKEFPNIDSSLIAAIYGDTKELGATRELLQELASTT